MGEWNLSLSKSSSDPLMPSAPQLDSSFHLSQHTHFVSHKPQFPVRRCMTLTEFPTPDYAHEVPSQYPNLLQLFNIFQFNRPEQPPARMVVTITLVGTLQRIRLLVVYDATVQDVIKASLKAFVKEGRLPRKDPEVQAYGLHYSQFCLESTSENVILAHALPSRH